MFQTSEFVIENEENKEKNEWKASSRNINVHCIVAK